MIDWNDVITGKDDKEAPCVLHLKQEEIQVKVFSHPLPELANGEGYTCEILMFSDLRQEWMLAGRLGDYDLNVVIALLAEVASALYRTRAMGAKMKTIDH